LNDSSGEVKHLLYPGNAKNGGIIKKVYTQRSFQWQVTVL